MKLDELIETLQKIQKDVNYQNIDVECSVDMSVEGEEETYSDRVFGKSPYMVRLIHEYDGKELKRFVQILFEENRSDFDGLTIMKNRGPRLKLTEKAVKRLMENKQ